MPQVKAMVAAAEEVVVVVVVVSVVVSVEEIAPVAMEVARGHSSSHRTIRDPRLVPQEELDKGPGSRQDPLHHPEEIHPQRMHSCRLSQ